MFFKVREESLQTKEVDKTTMSGVIVDLKWNKIPYAFRRHNLDGDYRY